MKKTIETIKLFLEGLLTKNEMDLILSRSQIYGAMTNKGKDFTGYDYKNQVWIQLHIS